MIEQLKTIRDFVESQRHVGRTKTLTALAQIEAAVGEPVAFVTDADVACFGKGAQGEIAALLHRQGKWCHPLFAGPPVAQQYEAGDMASAAAQGFRDGVVSVTQQEPVAWAMPKGDGTFIDVITPAEHAREEGSYTVPLFAHPVAQQPQAETDNHEAQGQLEFLDKKNNALSAAIRKVMARLADLLDEDQFKEIEDAISSAGVQPQAEPDDEIIKERDDAEDFIDMLLDEVLGTDRPEWTSAYGRDDALRDVQERMTALHKPMVDKAWERFEKAQQPQARPDFADEWTGYLKDGETPFERFLRERKDLGALTKLYQRALEENERLKAQQQQQADTPQATTIAEAARDVGKWLNERPNRPIDLRHVAMLVAHAMQPQAEKRCEYCDGTGDVHDRTGEWRGECHCQKQPQAKVVWVNPELEHMAEEAECVSMCLNDRGVPSKDGSKPLSLWGRVEQYANPRFLEGMTTNTPIVSSEHIKALAQVCRLIGNYTTAEFVQNVVRFAQVLLANNAVQEAFVKANTHLLYAAPQQAEAVPSEWVKISEWKWDNEQGHWLGKRIDAALEQQKGQL